MGCLKLTERDYIQLHDYSEKTAYSNGETSTSISYNKCGIDNFRREILKQGKSDWVAKHYR